MKRRLYAPAVILLGLLSAQLIATTHVYLSNRNLLQTTEALLHAQYLSVPNARVAAHLDTLTTAMAGGLLFTLSIGAGLAMLALAGVWVWDRVFQRSRKAALVMLLLWAGGIFLVNGNGWNPAASAYLAGVPLVSAMAALALLPAPSPMISASRVWWPVSAALILALLWGLVLDRHLFTHIRDHLLLGSPIGQSITNAYYAYTLFPAETFKSLAQKQIRTCTLDASLDRDHRVRLERLVRTHDCLPLPAGQATDLLIGWDTPAKQFYLRTNRGTVLSVTEKELFNDPQTALNTVADRDDHNRIFRTMSLLGLMLGLPLVLFALLFSGLAFLANRFLAASTPDAVATILCVLAGGLLLIPVYQGRSAAASLQDPTRDLAATCATTRIAALRQAAFDQRDIAAAAKAQAIQNNPHIAERYWLARSLAYAKDPDTAAMLRALADDPAPIVACQALRAMGERGDRQFIEEIIDRINRSSDWYIQLYGYRALRKLGWVQPQSPLLSY